MKPKVLIVDDSLTVRMNIGEALEEAGFQVTPCADLREARAALEREPYQLVVLDVLLPDGDGLDLLKEIKKGARPPIPTLLLSSEAEVQARIQGLGAGADEYVGKPYDLGQVVARARALTRSDATSGGDRVLRVLIIDDSSTFRNELRQALERTGYEVHAAASGEEGLALAAAVRPDAFVIDGILPGIDGVSVVRRLKSDAAFRQTPCLLLTGESGPAAELRALEAGADAFAQKTDDLGLILVRLRGLMRGALFQTQEAGPSLLGPKRLLAVDDSATYLNELGDQLRQEGYDVVLAKSGEDALALLAAQTVDCILLDLVMPGLSGQETCRRIKASAEWRDIPLVMLTARDDREAMIEGINAGADDYIAKSADFDVLKARLRAQLRRKHFEDENRRIQRQLAKRESEARFQRLISSDVIGVLVGDLSGGLLDANDAFLKLLGYTREELASGALRWSDLTSPEWRRNDEIAVEQLRELGSASTFEKEFISKEGHRIPVLVGLSLLEGTETFAGFVLDRSEQRMVEEQLKQYATALEEANHELESFSYSVAHDLRAPLRGMDGFSQALLEDYGTVIDDTGRRYLRRIREAAQHMAALIDDLLMLSRVTRSELRRERADLSNLVQATLTKLRTAQPDRVVHTRIQEGVTADADSRLLAIVFDNLIGNAWKFTSKRGEALIEFGVESDGTYFIRDNGAGFDMAFANKLFGVFQRLHSTTEFEGTGIGLATVQRVIRRHGGRVWAEGSVGLGATFRFTLSEKGPIP